MFNETPAFRRHALLPKCRHGKRDRSQYIPPLDDVGLGWLTSQLGPEERKLLREIAERGDVLEVDGNRYILAPISDEAFDALAAFEAEAADRENDLEDEAQDEDDDTDSDNALDATYDRWGRVIRVEYDDREEEPDRENTNALPWEGDQKTRETIVEAKRADYDEARDDAELRRAERFARGQERAICRVVGTGPGQVAPVTIDGVIVAGRFTPMRRGRL